MPTKTSIHHTHPELVVDDVIRFSREHEGSKVIILTSSDGLLKVAELHVNWFSEIVMPEDKHSAMLAGHEVYVDAGMDSMLLVALSNNTRAV